MAYLPYGSEKDLVIGDLYPGKLIMGKSLGSGPFKTVEPFINGMDLGELVELLMEEIDKLNKRVRELER